MSQHSNEVAKKAEKNPDLLGTTNTGTREKQSPATASKVERSLVQAEVLAPKDVVGNVSNRTDRAIDEEFQGDVNTSKAKREDKGVAQVKLPNPENRFAPNNTGLERKAEGQTVKKVDGVEVNTDSGYLRKDDDGLGREEKTVRSKDGTTKEANAEDNGAKVAETKAAKDNTKRFNDGLRIQQERKTPAVQVYASPVQTGKDNGKEKELVNTSDTVETNSVNKEENLANPENTDAKTAQKSADKQSSSDGSENSTKSPKDQAPNQSPQDK